MFSFTFLQILFYEPIACYLPDTEAAPQGIIFSPLSQRVASLMLGLKSLEQLHIGYLYRVSPGQSVQVRKVPCMDQTGILGAAFFCFAPPPPRDKKRNNSYLFEVGHEPFNLGSIRKNIQYLLKGSKFFWKE